MSEPAGSYRVVDLGALHSWLRPASVVAGTVSICVGATFGAGLLVATLAIPLVLAVHLPGDLVRGLRIAGDGMRIETLGHRRFVPWSDVVSVQRRDRRVTVVLRSGRAIELGRLEPGSGPFVAAAIPRPPGSLADDLAHAVARHRLAIERTSGLESELVGAGLGPEAWLQGLRGYGSGDDYRTATRRDELLEVIESSADPLARAAAAAAMRYLGPTPAERERALAVRMRVADPLLEAALAEAIDGADEGSDRALLRLRRARASPRPRP